MRNSLNKLRNIRVVPDEKLEPSPSILKDEPKNVIVVSEDDISIIETHRVRFNEQEDERKNFEKNEERLIYILKEIDRLNVMKRMYVSRTDDASVLTLLSIETTIKILVNEAIELEKTSGISIAGLLGYAERSKKPKGVKGFFKRVMDSINKKIENATLWAFKNPESTGVIVDISMRILLSLALIMIGGNQKRLK